MLIYSYFLGTLTHSISYLAFEPHGRFGEDGRGTRPPLFIIFVVIIIIFLLFTAFTEAALSDRRRLDQPGNRRKLCQALSGPFRQSGLRASLFPRGSPSPRGGYGRVPGHVERVKGCGLLVQGEKGGGAAGRTCVFSSLCSFLIFIVLVVHRADLRWPSYSCTVFHFAPRPILGWASSWSAFSICCRRGSCWFWDRGWTANWRGSWRALANGKSQEALPFLLLFFFFIFLLLFVPVLPFAHVPRQWWDLVTWFDLFTDEVK